MITKRVEPPKIVAGWKDIGTYLGKGVRTVQRYERELGLPVRRPAGKSHGAVIATRAELDAWVAASPVRAAFSLPKPPQDNGAFMNKVKAGIDEMRRLREQMAALRNDVISSVSLLRSSVKNVQQDMFDAWRQGKSFPVLDFDVPTSNDYDFGTPTKAASGQLAARVRKAS
jgi:hypothetical protein